MNDRERALAILHYESYDRMPVVHFGFWTETMAAWLKQGHISAEEANGGSRDHSPEQKSICKRLGFDFGWGEARSFNLGLNPCFEPLVVEEMPDGSSKVRNAEGVIELHVPGVRSIPMEFDHVLKDRASYEEHFKPRLQAAGRVDPKAVDEWLQARKNAVGPFGLYVGSLMGSFRNWIGVEGLSYLSVDDEELFHEICDALGDLCCEVTRQTLELCDAKGLKFDFAHMWEDICYKSGPLVNPSLFKEACGPHYKRLTGTLAKHGVDIVSLDCDGCIDSLVPIWLENGVNTMFPIEVGTWKASLKPWREKYGKKLHGVGGMDKKVFAFDKAAIKAEVERLKPLMDLGGYIPCPDHRIPPDAKWELVQYYCELMHKLKP